MSIYLFPSIRLGRAVFKALLLSPASFLSHRLRRRLPLALSGAEHIPALDLRVLGSGLGRSCLLFLRLPSTLEPKKRITAGCYDAHQEEESSPCVLMHLFMIRCCCLALFQGRWGLREAALRDTWVFVPMSLLLSLIGHGFATRVGRSQTCDPVLLTYVRNRIIVLPVDSVGSVF